MISIVILSTADITIKGLSEIFSEDEFSIVGIVDQFEMFKELIKEKRPDVAIIDTPSVTLPNTYSLSKIGDDLRDLSKFTGLISLVEYPDRSRFEFTRRAGVRGHCLKTVSSSDLIEAIKTIASGGTYTHKDYARAISSTESSVILELRKILSKRQMEILDLILLGLTNKEIASLLYLSIPTVKSHTSMILKKLGVSERSQVVSKILNSLIDEITKKGSSCQLPLPSD
ncbi:MAG: response regulator transcription factor [Actinomycetota bacterium]|nr:response regulator transcription factor [Actinomycetota bacterium]